MAEVYRNGVCNIAACNATDSSRSLYVQRGLSVGGSFTVTRKYTDQTVKFTLIPDWVKLTWDTAPLYARGWAVQERFLSARVMHFSKFPFWERSTTLTTEVYPTRLEPKILCFPALPETQRKWLSSTTDAESCVRRWWKLIKIYTKCSLTVKTDKLIALGGMAETFSKYIKEPYLAGIWRAMYPLHGLLWSVEEDSPREELGSAEYRGWLILFPLTKSPLNRRNSPVMVMGIAGWFGWPIPVPRILRPLAQVISIYTVPKSRNISGQLIGGELVLQELPSVVFRERGRKVLEVPRQREMYLDHHSLEAVEGNIYFLPLAEPLPEIQSEEARGMRAFTGIYLQK